MAKPPRRTSGHICTCLMHVSPNTIITQTSTRDLLGTAINTRVLWCSSQHGSVDLCRHLAGHRRRQSVVPMLWVASMCFWPMLAIDSIDVILCMWPKRHPWSKQLFPCLLALGTIACSKGDYARYLPTRLRRSSSPSPRIGQLSIPNSRDNVRTCLRSGRTLRPLSLHSSVLPR